MGEGEFIDQDFRRALMLSARVDVRSGTFENLADRKQRGWQSWKTQRREL